MSILSLLPESLAAFLLGVKRLLRHFPYTELLALFIPVYAYAIQAGKISSLSSLLLITPYIFSDAAGFIYNDMMDRRDPAVKENPMLTGQLSYRQARLLLATCLIASLLLFFALYHSALARVAYGIYLFLCLAYSGLGIRFKEWLVGPLVAAFIIWIGGPFLLALELGLLDAVMVTLLLGALLIYISREIFHTLFDYTNDLQSGYQTFSVRLALPVQYAIKGSTAWIGLGLLVLSVYNYSGGSGWESPLALFLFCLLGAAAVAESVFCLGLRLPFYPQAPYLLVRLFFVGFAALMLRVGPWIALFFVWIFVTSKRP